MTRSKCVSEDSQRKKFDKKLLSRNFFSVLLESSESYADPSLFERNQSKTKFFFSKNVKKKLKICFSMAKLNMAICGGGECVGVACCSLGNQRPIQDGWKYRSEPDWKKQQRSDAKLSEKKSASASWGADPGFPWNPSDHHCPTVLRSWMGALRGGQTRSNFAAQLLRATLLRNLRNI